MIATSVPPSEAHLSNCATPLPKARAQERRLREATATPLRSSMARARFEAGPDRAIFAADVDDAEKSFASTAKMLVRAGTTGDLRLEADAEEERRKFKAAAALNRQALKRMKRCTLNPHSELLALWDCLTICALFYTCFVTPYEASAAGL